MATVSVSIEKKAISDKEFDRFTGFQGLNMCQSDDVFMAGCRGLSLLGVYLFVKKGINV